MPGVAAVQIGGMLGSQSITRDDASCISTLPTGQRPAWVIQQLREAFGFEIVSRHLVFDRDPIFSAQVVATLKSFGIEPTRTACRSPWQNGVAERWIGSVRREMLDHVVVFNERHLRRLLRDYVAYYHDERTHLGLDKKTPAKRQPREQRSQPGSVVALPRLGGLHHRYEVAA